MSRVEFVVPFVAGLQRPRMAMRNGVPVMHDTDANVANKAAIRAAYRNECLRVYGTVVSARAHVPVSVLVGAHAELPPSVRPKRLERQPHTVKPDLDNVVKLVLDALNGYAWHDDCQVDHIEAFKFDRTRGIEPHTVITIVTRDPEEES
ncbi:MAG: RusA family crossover junction endodeoxyribonuclease [Atopobiaceae bacterium]|nr:RusA family crossover junction endodeoxyribonuclease [Atopobiaceae bacterium]